MGTLSALRRAPAAASPPPISPARARLAERLAILSATKARIAALEAAQTRATLAVRAASDAHATALTAIEATIRAAAQHATAAILDGTTTTGPSVSAARASATEAEDALRTAEQVRAMLATEAAALPGQLMLHEMAFNDCIRVVLREEMSASAASLMSEIETLHRQMVDKGRALQWLIHEDVVIEWGPNATPGVSELSTRFTSLPTGWSLWNAADVAPTETACRAALERLKQDPTAPVPVLP